MVKDLFILLFFYFDFFFIDTNILKKGNKLQSSAKKRVVATKR